MADARPQQPAQLLARLEVLEGQQRRAKRAGRLLALTCAVLVALALPLRVLSAPGNSQQGGLPSVEQRVASLEALVQSLQGNASGLAQRVTALEAQHTQQAQQIALLQTANAQEEARLAALEDKLVHVTRQGNELYITGANLNIRNGLGFTRGATDGAPSAVNGLGNLIIGYNEQQDLLPGGYQHDRSGSHNLVVGRANGYSSFGGFVGGFNNQLGSAYSSILAGVINTTTSPFSSISAGRGNVTGGNYAGICGGDSNHSDGETSVVSGGFGRTVGGLYDWRAGSLFQDQ